MNIPDENMRVQALVNHFSKGNVSNFISKLDGISHQRLNRIFSPDPKNKRYPSVSSGIITAINKGYPSVNPKWLLTGNGSMLFSDENKPEVLQQLTGPVSITLQDYINKIHEHEAFMRRVIESGLYSLKASSDEISDNLARIESKLDVKSVDIQPEQILSEEGKKEIDDSMKKDGNGARKGSSRKAK